MITEPTALILGAGASVDYGFPLGRGLITAICNTLAKSTSSLYRLLLDCGCAPEEIGQFRSQLNDSNLPSIDAFLENRKEFEQIGKLAIAGVLIPFENKERLNRSSEPLRWYEYLHGKIIGKKEDYFKNKLVVVTFNYDRSFEYALFLAIKNSYGLQDEECTAYMQAIPIIHIYGQLGVPFWMSKEGRPYKGDLTPQQVITYAKSIRVVHEGDRQSIEFQDAQEAIREACVVCCLGFGYHPENIKRMQLQQTLPGEKKKLYLSAYGFTEKQLAKLKEKILPKKLPLDCTAVFGQQKQDVLTFLQETAALE